MFNTKKTMKRRLSAALALVMGLSLCSGFGFAKDQTVWAAEDAVAVEETVNGATAVSGGAVTGPGAEGPVSEVYPIRCATNGGEVEIFATDSEGNAIAEAEAGTEVMVEVNLDSEFFEYMKFMGFIVWGMDEEGNANWEDVIVDLFDMENASATASFIMPDRGVVVGFTYGGYWMDLVISGGKVTKINGETLENLELEFTGTMSYGVEVTVEAVAPSGMLFAEWEVVSGNVELANPKSQVTTFIMPKEAVELKANFVSAPAGSTTTTTTTPSVEEKNPDVVTEEDVFTEEEIKLFDELKVDAVIKEAQEKVEAFVEKVLKLISEEVKDMIKENVVFGKLPTDDKTPAAGLKNDPLELFVKTLTLEERARAMKGETISLTTQAKDVTDTVSKADKLLVDKAMKDIAAILNNGKSADEAKETKLGMFLDLALVKKVGNDTPSAVEATEGKLEVSIQVPAALQNKKADAQRVYQVLLVADGKTTLLDAKFNAKTGELAFETDVFGTFALIYTDMPVAK